ncbi:hypothetical protein GGD57_002435 [Rhizobium esperanzae]|uniref:Uncharacterized protein n=1 Tax=Rhizobium esperanzae TaxID=1967781 RepID=A0A7W6R2X8_9HYPH|nr:hypothetical protein [Rhizobium esperanzae]
MTDVPSGCCFQFYVRLLRVIHAFRELADRPMRLRIGGSVSVGKLALRL